MNPKDKTFEQLSELQQQHFKPKRLEVVESYRFHRCFQEENETVSVYSARWCPLVGELPNRSFRDQFVCCIQNPATRKKLLSEDRTFQQALEVAIADEIAPKESVHIPFPRILQFRRPLTGILVYLSLYAKQHSGHC